MTAQSFTYSGNVYTGAAAGTVDFALTSTAGNPILYLENAHIHVYKSTNQGGTWTELTRPSQWNFVSSGTVARLATGTTAGDWIKVQRITPSTSSYVTFQASSLLTAEQLNDDTLFNTYLNQERFDQGEQSSLVATTAETAANAASTTATNAANTAAGAVATANAASASAANAVSTANASSASAANALTASSNAVTTANSAVTTANSAVTTANSAVTTANAASATANTANSKADQAIAVVGNSVLYELVANVAGIPGSPTNNKAVEIYNSTGIESFTPLANKPAGFVGSSGLSVRIIYSTSGSTWNWVQYFPNDPETRYLKFSGGTLTGQLRGHDSASASTPGFAFDGDPDTGIGRLGANELGVITGGIVRLSFDAAGNGTFTNSVTIPAGSTVTGYLTTASAASTYLTQANAASTYAPLASPTFTGTVTIPAGASISGYLTTGAIGSTVQAYNANTAVTNAAQNFTAAQRGGYVTLTDAATVAIDLSLGNHYQVTLGGNRTIGAPTNVVAGQSGVIRLVQDATGSRTASWNSVFKFPGGTAPTLTTAANSVDLVAYHVESATRIAARFIGDVK